MVTQDFRDLMFARPFRPFRLVMSSGNVYDVRHPETGIVTRTTIYVFTPRPADQPKGTPVYCSLLHVAGVEFLDDLLTSGPPARYGDDGPPSEPESPSAA